MSSPSISPNPINDPITMPAICPPVSPPPLTTATVVVVLVLEVPDAEEAGVAVVNNACIVET